MKKAIPLILTSLMAFGLVSCKKGMISGQVLDAFSEKPVENATVWVDNTPYQVKSADGSFKFEKLEPGSFKVNAGKNKFSKTFDSVTITDAKPETTVNLYLYSRESVDPGLYTTTGGVPSRIQNQWLNWESPCKESVFGYRQKFADAKTKKDLVLPQGMAMKTEFNALFNLSSSAPEAVTAKVFPMSEGKFASHKDCEGFDAKKEVLGLFPDVSKAIELTSKVKSDNLYQISGTLPAGKQAIALFQGNKLLKSYLFEVK